MGKASSAKKLARAARAGKVSKGRERRDLGFPLVIALVIILGSSLVLYARNDKAEAVAPKLNVDHWHAALGFYNCDHFEDPIARGNNWPDPTGIHSHDDGIVHIHPFSSAASGTRARLKVFFETMQVKFSDNEVELTNGVKMTDGADCNGKTAHLVVARFQVDKPDQAPQIIESSLGDVRFLADREAFTVALVPDDERDKIPLPPTAANLDELGAADSGAAPTPSVPSTTVDPNAPTTAPTTTAAAGPSSSAGGESSTTTATTTTSSR